jgi:hypothetical protein
MALTATDAKAPAIITGSDPRRPSRYEAPYKYSGSESSKDRILGWMRESVNEAEQFLRSQSGYQFVDMSYRIMNDIGFGEVPKTWSKASMNFVKRDVRELLGMLSNPRPITSYKTGNRKYDPEVNILNQLYMGWYYMQFVDRSIADALKYAGVEGTGYLCMEWDPGYFGGHGDIKLSPLGVDAVLPVQINPEGWDLQTSYATVIRRQFPITHVLRRFPQFANIITPDGESVGRMRRILNNIMDRVTPTVHNTYGSQRGYRGEDPASRHYVTVYDIYIQDSTCNTSGREIPMGVPGSPWEYKVPSYGSDIPLPYADPRTGQIAVRKADWHDCRMFPYRRHIVATRNAVLYDDTSRYWHGQIPLTKFTLDSWPQEYCGIPLTKEPAKVQAMATSLLRAYDDSTNARLRPNMTFDGNRTNPAEARAFDPRTGGQVFEASDVLGPVFKSAIDPAIYNLAPETMKLIDYLRQTGSDLIGCPGLKELSKAAQVPSGDSIEKLMEIAGPLPTELSRNMEASLRCMGEQFKSLAFEFYNAARRFVYLGPDGLTERDFDYDPAQLVPADIPGVPPNSSRVDRARAHMQNFFFWILPNSVYGITQVTRKLLMLQLSRAGLPISPYTILEQFDVPNPGRPPGGATTEIEKWKAWKMEEAKVMIDVQMMLTMEQMKMQMQTPLGQLSGAIQNAIQKPTSQEGRPPSGQKSPHLESKDGGERQTISES